MRVFYTETAESAVSIAGYMFTLSTGFVVIKLDRTGFVIKRPNTDFTITELIITGYNVTGNVLTYYLMHLFRNPR